MPMAWVPLELQLAELRSNGIFIISLDDLTDLNMSNDDLSLPEKELKHFLRCQHSLGKLMYFDSHRLDKFVIVQPTALVDILRAFITDEIFWPKDPPLHDILSTIHESGLIKKSDLFQLWAQDQFNNHFPNEELKEFMTKVLVHLDILVEPKRFTTRREDLATSFIVPCMIRQPFSSSQFPCSTDEDKTIFLSYRINKSTIPNAMIYKLIGAVINIWPIKKVAGLFCLFNKAAVLEIDQDNELCITFNDNRVIISLANSKSKSFITPNIASVIQEVLTLTVNRVTEFYRTAFMKSNLNQEIQNIFEIEVGEMCQKEICFRLLSDIQNKDTWTCKNHKEHITKFPLYWVCDKKLDKCPIDCPGIDKKCLDMVPLDKHLIRLARLIGRRFYEFIILLELPAVEWEDIEDNANYRSDRLAQRFVGLCKWKQNKQAMNCSPTFRDLFKALAATDYNEHFLCQVFRQKYTEVYDIDDPKLQDTPDDVVLHKLSREIGPCALHLGVELGIKMPSIEHTQEMHSKDTYSQTYDILLKWKDSCKVKPTVRALMLALQYADPRGFVFLKDQYDIKEKPTDEA